MIDVRRPKEGFNLLRQNQSLNAVAHNFVVAFEFFQDVSRLKVHRPKHKSDQTHGFHFRNELHVILPPSSIHRLVQAMGDNYEMPPPHPDRRLKVTPYFSYQSSSAPLAAFTSQPAQEVLPFLKESDCVLFLVCNCKAKVESDWIQLPADPRLHGRDRKRRAMASR